ncbi:MAG: hypothetical protein WCY09_10420 [Candidatus Omnitrophota bacterium]|jgi:DnaJ-class molecular chaperone
MKDEINTTKTKFTPHRCVNCNGWGTVTYKKLKCHTCNGTGVVIINQETGEIHYGKSGMDKNT